jgi:hypothetical protein
MATTTQPSTSTSRRRRESQKQVLIPMATGSDESEVILLATTLQNFGALVVLAAVDEPSRQCGMMGGFLMTADIQIEQAHQYDWDCIVIPGGGECIMCVCVCVCVFCTINKSHEEIHMLESIVCLLACLVAHLLLLTYLLTYLLTHLPLLPLLLVQC